MGNNGLRNYLHKESRWTDKFASKHKHNYCIEANVELSHPICTLYFHVMKCEHCNSFRSIPKQGSVTGMIEAPIKDLPTIRLYKTHKTIGFRDAELKESCD